MKLYIATLVKHDEYFITHERTFASKDPVILSADVCAFLDGEEIPFDHIDVLMQCKTDNQGGEPLSLGTDTDLCHEWLLCTSIQETESI